MISNDWTAALLKRLAEADTETPAFDRPSALTYSGGSFFHHQSGALGVLFAMLDASIFADNATHVASKILASFKGDATSEKLTLPKGFDPHLPLSTTPGPHLRRLRFVLQPMMEMLVIRLADNLTTYLLDVAGECIQARPGLLKSSKDQLSTEAILSFTTIEELQLSLIERKLISIAYLNLEKQLDWMSDHLGVAGLTLQPCFPSLLDLMETRNCMVHNRARVGAKYLKSLAPFGVSAKQGQLLKPSADDLFVAAQAAAEFVTVLDAELMAKFGLKPAPVDPPGARQEIPVGDGNAAGAE